ncbi:hypothetical protein PV10_01150 [Exophiala mesophila]|uniref:Uncharacterized protein n=1 Tax=Exophiala mesophila TaxID=212818 RepID=A0A0D1ZTY5_EXOME|nr:uncharacterized protein PV10_01150 [Exophiala mesophila]KIV97394.1 hypothetical protein PV10_01150 [Exophiala mesophila]
MGPIKDPYYGQLYKRYKNGTKVVVDWLSEAGHYKENVLTEYAEVARRLARQGVVMPPHVLQALKESTEARETINRWHQATGSDNGLHDHPVVVLKAILAVFTAPLGGPAPRRALSLPGCASEPTGSVAHQKDADNSSEKGGRASQSDSELEWRRGVQQQPRQQQQHRYQHRQRQQPPRQELQQPWRRLS